MSRGFLPISTGPCSGGSLDPFFFILFRVSNSKLPGLSRFLCPGVFCREDPFFASFLRHPRSSYLVAPGGIYPDRVGEPGILPAASGSPFVGARYIVPLFGPCSGGLPPALRPRPQPHHLRSLHPGSSRGTERSLRSYPINTRVSRVGILTLAFFLFALPPHRTVNLAPLPSNPQFSPLPA